MGTGHFIDFYEILQVSPNADPDTVERVYRLLAKRFHPDNGTTGSPEKFKEIAEAYQVLSDPEKRAGYDARYESDRKNQWSAFLEAPNSGVDEDRRTQRWILSLLYRLRRRGASDPGMGGIELENYLELSEGQLDFHLWYMREKGWIRKIESGKFAITADGVDFISEEDQVLRKDRLIEEGQGAYQSEASSPPSEEADEEIIPFQPYDSLPDEKMG